MNILNYILGGFSLVGLLGLVSGYGYGIYQRTTITTLRESNDAYKDRNRQLEDQITKLTHEYSKKLAELEGRIKSLEAIKTPPYKPMMELITSNHKEVMAAIKETK